MCVCVRVGAPEVEGWVFKKLKALEAGSLPRCRRSRGSLLARGPLHGPGSVLLSQPQVPCQFIPHFCGNQKTAPPLGGRLPSSDRQVKAIWEPAEHRQ